MRTAPLFGSTTSSCGARRCQRAALFDLDDAREARTCITALNLVSSSCVATLSFLRSRPGGSLRRILELFTEEENEAFTTIGYTIGGMMVFPGNRIDGKQTINGARGFQ